MKIKIELKSFKLTNVGEVNNISIINEVSASEISTIANMTLDNLPKMLEIVKTAVEEDRKITLAGNIKGLTKELNYLKSLKEEEKFELYSEEKLNERIKEVEDKIELLKRTLNPEGGNNEDNIPEGEIIN